MFKKFKDHLLVLYFGIVLWKLQNMTWSLSCNTKNKLKRLLLANPQGIPL